MKAKKLNQLEQEYLNMMTGYGEAPESPEAPEVDKTPPTVQIVTGEVTENSIAVTEYTIKVVVFDKAGNKEENSTKESTNCPEDVKNMEKLIVFTFLRKLNITKR